MDNIFNVISEFQPYVVIGLSILVILLIILVITLYSAVNKLEKKYKRLMRGVNNANLEESLVEYIDMVEKSNSISEEIGSKLDEINSRIDNCVQKVSTIRYKAFDDVGSDLSFSIAILNNNNNGVIITGIYGRNESTTYAKPIDKGISRYDLSEEELYVLNECINK